MTVSHARSPIFEDLGPVTLAHLAEATGVELGPGADPQLMIHRVSILSRADPQSLTFVTDKKYLAELAGSEAGACVLPPGLVAVPPPTVLSWWRRIPRPSMPWPPSCCTDPGSITGKRQFPRMPGSRTELTYPPVW
ncbi:MAG: hypothetical protein CGW95_06280 [Phenylobacterium zucineum]|nr:MAG: hypothetical protein CGW95_06280 [Phenylobacterium zucineum]